MSTPEQRAARDRESTTLMIQWVLWKHLAKRLVLDGERMQQLAEQLSHDLYAEGVRMPLDDDSMETTITLQSELLNIVKGLPAIPVPQVRIRERTREMARKLYEAGWRKYADLGAAAALMAFEVPLRVWLST